MATHFSGKCIECQTQCWWQDCPTGGWWIHTNHPADNHDADPGWRPMERMDDNGEWVTA
jgi:hypothetical protein